METHRIFVTRRRVLSAAAASATTASIAAAATFAACAPGPSGGPVASDVQGPLVWSARVQTEENLWQQNAVLPKMKEKFPKLNLSVETAPSNEWAVKLIGLYAAGTPPDIHAGFAGIIISLYAQGQALELTPFIKRDKFDLAAFGGLQNDPDMCRSGKMWGLPVDTSLGAVVFYNAAMLQQAGVPLPPTSWQDRTWTWDRALDIARRTTKNWGESDAVYGFVGSVANPWFQIWPYLWNGDLWPKEFYAQGIGQTSQLTTPPVVESLQHIQDLALKHRVMPAPGQGAPAKPMNVGGAAMWVQTIQGGVAALKDVTFPWGIAPLPRQATNKSVAYTNSMMVNKDSKNPEGAWQVLKYIASQEGQIDRIRITPAPAVRADAFDPWLDSVQPKTVHKSKAELKEVATGYLASYSDAWPHFVADSSTILPVLNELHTNLLGAKGTAASLLADAKTQVETQMRATYDKFKTSPLARDTACT